MDKRDSQNQKRYQERQPQEWEDVLNDVTMDRNWRENAVDPALLSKVQEAIYDNPLEGLTDVFHDEECLRQIESIRQIADQKLKGIQRTCVLMQLATGLNYKNIAAMLKVSDDTVSRQIQKSIPKIKSYFKPSATQEFPVKPKTRPVIRCRIFPLDNDAERREFQDFVNDHVVTHISHSCNGRFREALAVYLTGKPANNPTLH